MLADTISIAQYQTNLLTVVGATYALGPENGGYDAHYYEKS